jgi:glycosyltransferase involved in cell wall biosynthesis
MRTVAVVGGLSSGTAESLKDYGYRAETLCGDSFVGLARDLHKLRPAALHASQGYLKVAAVARLMGVPLVLQAGRDDTGAGVAWAARMSDRTVCAGASVREALLRQGAPASSTVVLRSLVDPGEHDGAHPPMLDPNVRWVVAASPCDGPDRGHQDLLLAFFAAARGRPDLKLLVAGEGPVAQRLREQAEGADMRNRVVVHAVGTSQLPAIFAHAAVVVAPSRTGNSPDAVPEAQAVGAAVIATGVGSHPVWVREGRTGWLVPPRAPVALGIRLAQVLDDPQMARRVGAAAQRAAAEAATPRSVAQELARCYAVIARTAPATSRVSHYLPDPTLSRA